jgi:hypothetical protein
MKKILRRTPRRLEGVPWFCINLVVSLSLGKVVQIPLSFIWQNKISVRQGTHDWENSFSPAIKHANWKVVGTIPAKKQEIFSNINDALLPNFWILSWIWWLTVLCYFILALILLLVCLKKSYCPKLKPLDKILVCVCLCVWTCVRMELLSKKVNPSHNSNGNSNTNSNTETGIIWV